MQSVSVRNSPVYRSSESLNGEGSKRSIDDNDNHIDYDHLFHYTLQQTDDTERPNPQKEQQNNNHGAAQSSSTSEPWSDSPTASSSASVAAR